MAERRHGRIRYGLTGLAATVLLLVIAGALIGPGARPAGADALAILGMAPAGPAQPR